MIRYGFDLSHRVFTNDLDATAGEDYIQTAEIISFSAGETTKELRIPIVDDNKIENEVSFVVAMTRIGPTRPSVKYGDRTEVTVIIEDNDRPTNPPTNPPATDSPPASGR